MGDLVNLKARRKQARRQQQEEASKQSRIRHGRTKAETLRDRAAAEREARAKEGAKLER
ncbi:MAG: DUF4169 family protein [Acetobacteraceae bacterium]|nr:DUF4169 family protein [Acetobacteraceae bacterium]